MANPRPRPGARGGSEVLLGSDASESTPAPRKIQARPIGDRHRADFARDAVFVEFGYHAGRAIDYPDFVDRTPNPAPAWWRS